MGISFKPAWQRLLIMVGGVLMNFLLAIFIYSMIYSIGRFFVSLQDMTHGMKFNERAREIGFRDGDILLRADENHWSVSGWICFVILLRHVQ